MPESFTEPEAAYATAKRRGMDLVTLTDHNTIAGALEIAHHPDVVIGVEATVEFPEDRVPVHVLVWGLDEARWADMDRLRGNLYELVDYAAGAGLPHALAHPLHRVGGELTADHLERCLLLFRLWEGRNGARPREGNEVGARIARSASGNLLDRLGREARDCRAGGRASRPDRRQRRPRLVRHRRHVERDAPRERAWRPARPPARRAGPA